MVKKLFFFIMILVSLFLVSCSSNSSKDTFSPSEINTTNVQDIINDDTFLSDASPDTLNNSVKTILEGIIFDDPISSATIDVLELNGTLIKRFESITDQNGSYKIELSDDYSEKDIIIKAYNGQINNQDFNGELYGYKLSNNQDTLVNATPLTTLTYYLSNDFIDKSFSNRINYAKELLKSTCNISDNEIVSVNDNNIVNIDLEKFRKLVKENGFNYVINDLLHDVKDGFIDSNLSSSFIVSTKKRVFQQATAFSLDLNDSSDINISSLYIKGLSKDESGNSGSLGKLTDVVSINTEGNIAYRSFNIGEWKGLLNEETTLLARVFLDIDLINLPEKTQEYIAHQLINNHSDEIQNILLYQDLATTSSLINKYYFELIQELSNNAKKYIASNSLNNLNEENVSKAIARIIKRSNQKSSARSLSAASNFNVNEEEINLGIIHLKNTSENLEIANYVNTNFGLRPYKIDENLLEDYEYNLFGDLNNITPVSGGIVGGLYDWTYDRLHFKGQGFKYDDLLKGSNFTSLSDVHELQVEIYKWQGLEYTSIFNTLDGINLVLKALNIANIDSSNLTKSFDYENVKQKVLYAEASISVLQMLLNFTDFVIEKGSDIDKTDEYKSYKATKQVLFQDIDTMLKIVAEVKDFLSVQGYSVPDQNSEESKNVFKEIIVEYTNKLFLGVPRSTKNDFHQRMDSLLDKEFNKYPKTKDIGRLFYFIIEPLIKNIIKQKTAENKITDTTPTIDKFNAKYEKIVSFSQMHFVASYISYNISNSHLMLKENTNFENINQIDNAMADYLRIVIEHLFTNFDGSPLVSILRSGFKDSQSFLNSVKLVKDLLKKTKSTFKELNKGEMFTSIGFYLIDTFADELKQNIAPKLIKSAMSSLIGAGGAKLALAANDISSYVAGNFLVANKQYFLLENINNTISITPPPVNIIGINKAKIIQTIKSIDTFEYKPINNSYLWPISDQSDIGYRPQFDVLLYQYNNGVPFLSTSDFTNMLVNSTFDNKEFIKFSFNIEKSEDNNIFGNFIPFGSENNQNSDITITTEDMKKTSLKNVGDNVYYFDIIDVWTKKQDSASSTVVLNKTRGVFRDSIDVEYFQPEDSKLDVSINEQSLSYYVYKPQNSDVIEENMVIKKFEKDGHEWIRIQNNNVFDIYMETAYDEIDHILNDTRTSVGDYLITANSFIELPLYNLFLDDKGNHNDVVFYFYDTIAQTFFENNSFSEPRLYNYSQAGYTDLGIAYKLRLEDVEINEYLLLQTVDSTKFDTDAKLTFSFNTPVDISGINFNITNGENSVPYTSTSNENNISIVIDAPVAQTNYHVSVLSTSRAVDNSELAMDYFSIFYFTGEANIAPTTKNAIYSFEKDSTDNTIVLEATDEDYDKLTYTLTSQPANGILEGTPPNLTYTPNIGYSGIDSFGFIVSDGSDEVSAIVSIGVIEPTQNEALMTHNGFKYGTVTSPYTGRIWLDRNLGSNRVCITFDDTECYGDYYQWGRNSDGHEKSAVSVTSTISSSVTNIGHSDFITSFNDPYDWTSEDNDGSLRSFNLSKSDGSYICPVGYRVPTIEELEAEISNIGSYNSNDVFNSFLKLPSAGLIYPNGSKNNQGSYGLVLSASPYQSYVKALRFAIDDREDHFYYYRADGFSVRCIKQTGNTVPIANAQSMKVDQNSLNNVITLTAKDADADNLTYIVVKEPSFGTLEGTPPNLTYTPNIGYSGIDSFDFMVNDGSDEATATVSIEINSLEVTTASIIKKTGQTKSYDTNGNEITDGTIKDDGYYQKGTTPSYTRNEDDTVKDNITGLMWQDDEAAATVQKQFLSDTNYDTCYRDSTSTACYDTSGDTAATYCSELTLGGYDDWRLPSSKELESIVDYSHYDPAIDTNYFYNVGSINYWSSTTYEYNEYGAWYVGFSSGYVDYLTKDVSYYVRCVREGQ